jgi:hypothetical protein
MPRISTFYGIVIAIYYDDYAPPHFQAIYSGEEAVISINNLELVAGGSHTPSQLPESNLDPGRGPATLDGSRSYLQQAQQWGYTLRLNVTGPRTHITRVVYVYLPPQYFQPAYSRYRFPAIELIHGQPGEPQDWINVVGVTSTFDQLMARKQARPAVLVMPDANGGERISLQCLNQVHGPQDLTYLGVEVPNRIAHLLRVEPPGPAWGVAGYSEGGFCAANMGHPVHQVSPFGRSAALRKKNTPLDTLLTLPADAVIPRFWLGAGADNAQDVANAELFWRELVNRQPQVPLVITPGGGHNMATWRAEVPLMLRWMTPRLAQAAHQEAAAQSAAPALAAKRAHGHSRLAPVRHQAASSPPSRSKSA